MDCQRCGGPNPTGAGFCMKCGSALASKCGTCGQELPPEAEFCFKCGQKVKATSSKPAASAGRDQLTQYIPPELLAKLNSARAGGGMQGERRVVTILFCDVKGSTAAAEKLDPEEWHEIMNGAFAHLIAPVYRYEGTLARLMGDAILAFFGAPIAHEDDPQRAILAALDILGSIQPYREQVKRRWAIDFDVRVGINTGLVVVGEVGSDLRVEYTAMGDAVNLASRMESTAAPGTIQVSDQTHKAVAPLFDFEDLGEVVIKGKSAPVRVFRPLRQKETPGRLRGIEGISSPMVGRDGELRELKRLTGELRRGRGTIVSIVAEAGLGKSRLAAEWARWVGDGNAAAAESGEDSTIKWCEGRAQSYETGRPFAPFAGLIARSAGLRRDLPEAAAYQQLRDHLASYSGALAGQAAFLASVVGIRAQGSDAELVQYLTPPQLKHAAFAAARAYFEAVSAREGCVLAIDDLHWADETSIELLVSLLPLTDRRPLLIAALLRPRQQEPSWRFHETASRDFPHRHHSLHLAPLDDARSRELVANLLHVEGLPGKMRSLILERAEGNPFFVEEVIRSLVDSGAVVREGDVWRATRDIDRISIPQTIGALLTSRLDGLDEGSRRVAQTASVMGREFDRDVLAQVAPDGCDLDPALLELQRRGLVRERSAGPVNVYWFRHGLIQEAAYQSLLLKTRRELHRAIAVALEKSGSREAVSLSRHYLEGGDEERALPWLVDAGESAMRAFAVKDAIARFEQAVEISSRVAIAPLAKRAFEGLFEIRKFTMDGKGAYAVLDRMEEFGRSHGIAPMQVSAMNKRGYVMAMFAGEVDEADRILKNAETIARGQNDLAGLAEMNMYHCMIDSSRGLLEEAESHLSEAVSIGRQLGAPEPELFGMVHTANVMFEQLRIDEGWSAARAALKRVEESGNRAFEADLYCNTLPFGHMLGGRMVEATEAVDRGIELADRIGAMMSKGMGLVFGGMIARLRGDYGRSIRLYERAIAGAGPFGFLRAAAQCGLGGLFSEINEAELGGKSAELHRAARESMKEPMGDMMGAMIFADLGFCALERGDGDEAAKLFETGLEHRSSTMHVGRPMLLLGIAMTRLAARDAPGAKKFLDEAREYVEARQLSFFTGHVSVMEGMFHLATGDAAAAERSFAAAAEVARRNGMRPLLFQALGARARALRALGRPAEAEAVADLARSTAAFLSDSLDGTDYRTHFDEAVKARTG